jgi:MFS family permease
VAWSDHDAYTLALAATVLTAGSIADRYGRRRRRHVLQGVLHLSPIQSGMAYVPASVLMFFTAAATAGLTRFDPRLLLTIGLGLVTIGLVSGLLADEHSSRLALLPAQIIGLIGCGLFNPVMSGLVLREGPAGQEALSSPGGY